MWLLDETSFSRNNVWGVRISMWFSCVTRAFEPTPHTVPGYRTWKRYALPRVLKCVVNANHPVVKEELPASSDPENFDLTSDTASERTLNTPVWSTEEPTPKEEARWNYVDETYNCLLELYIFADAHETRLLRNDVMTAIHYLAERSRTYLGFEQVSRAFDTLPQTSTMCRYLVASNTYHWHPDGPWSKKFPPSDTLPSAFLLGIMTVNSRRANSPNDDDLVHRMFQICASFHEHDNDAERKQCTAQEMSRKPSIYSILQTCMAAVEKEGVTISGSSKSN
jgi:hypothetical protein